MSFNTEDTSSNPYDTQSIYFDRAALYAAASDVGPVTPTAYTGPTAVSSTTATPVPSSNTVDPVADAVQEEIKRKRQLRHMRHVGNTMSHGA